jgi:hypothetical protein
MPDHTDVARFGWTPRDLVLVPACVLFVAVGTIMAMGGEVLLGTLATLLGGAYMVIWLIVGLSRRVALAVTADGITLGAVPPWPVSRTAFVPWSDVETVVLWQQATGYTRTDYVGVHRREGAPPLPGSARSPLLRRVNMMFVPAGLPAPLVADSRPASCWRLDKVRLVAAVNQFAPQVAVVDET